VGEGKGDFPQVAVAVDGGGEGRRPETGRQLGADLKFVGEIRPRGETDLGLLYVSPEDETAADDSAMPFIGFSAEELASPFTGTVTFTMTGFTYTGLGTGNFYLFEGNSLFWDSSAGAGSYGSFSVNVGSHGHGEFGFSDLGLYVITLQASGNDGSPVSGESATFRFDVVPEPTCGTLLLTAFSVGMSLRRRFFRS
jgi:surface-anchored protein